MTREEAFVKTFETDAWNRLTFTGPVNTDELIATFIIYSDVFFIYAGAATYKPAYDVLQPFFKELQEKAFLQYTDGLRTSLRKRYDADLQGETLSEALKHRAGLVIDCLQHQIAEAAYKPGEIKNLIGDELYNKIDAMIDAKILAEWASTKTSPLIDACLAVTSNCIGGEHDN